MKKLIIIALGTFAFWAIFNLGDSKEGKTQEEIQIAAFLLDEIVIKQFIAEVTAYSPPLFPKGQLTFSETPVGPGTIAVDPKIISLGSKVKIQGFDETFHALDTGRLIKGEKIDIWMPSLQEALEWGRRRVEIKIVIE